MSSKKLGRPRDELIRQRILDTASTMLLERGYSQTTMKEISLAAKVSKQTLYRWWSNRAELLMEAFAENARENIVLPNDISGHPNLEAFLENTFRESNKKTNVLLKSLLGEGISNTEFAKVFFDRFIKKRQLFLAKNLKKIPELRNASDERINSIVDLIYGAFWYRVVFEHRPLNKLFAKEITEIILGHFSNDQQNN